MRTDGPWSDDSTAFELAMHPEQYRNISMVRPKELPFRPPAKDANSKPQRQPIRQRAADAIVSPKGSTLGSKERAKQPAVEPFIGKRACRHLLLHSPLFWGYLFSFLRPRRWLVEPAPLR